MEIQTRGWLTLAAVSSFLVALGPGVAGAMGGETLPAPLALEHVAVVNVRDGTLGRDRTVVLQGDRIVAVVPATGRARLPGERRIDLSGRFVLPGLVDMHAHVLLHPWDERGRILPRSDRASTLHILRALLSEGVTTARDPGDPADAAVALRADLERGGIVGPRLMVAGDMLQTGDARLEPFRRVASEEDVRREVRRQAAAGVDFIKLYAGLSPPLVRAAIDEAHAHGLRVIGHLQRTSWTEAAEAGIDGVEHLAAWSPELLPDSSRSTLTPDLFGRVAWLEHVALDSAAMDSMLATLARHGVTVDPTLIALHSKFWGNDPSYRHPARPDLVPDLFQRGWPAGSFTASWTDSQYAAARASWPRAEALVRRMHAAGIRMVVGTDTPTPWIVPGESVHREMELLHAAGLPIADVLRMATADAADALGLGGQIGAVAPGMRADLVVLSADPLEDIRNTRRIERVVSRGVMRRPAEILRP